MERNIKALNHVREGLENMPNNIDKLYDQFKFLLVYCEDIKCNAYWGAISSGSMNEINSHDDIFNDLQIAINNIEMTVTGLKMTTEVFKDFALEGNQLKNPKKVADYFISRETRKVQDIIKMAEQAKNTIAEFLSSENVTFSTDVFTTEEIPRDLFD